MSGRPDELAMQPGLVDTRHDPGEQKMRARLADSLFGAPAAPVRVGRYLVIEEIGSGGLGVVYSAYDPQLDRKIALKLVNPARVTPRTAARMQREAQAMARVTHPNVVAVHDAGEHGDGVFIAMELVGGVTLRAWKRAQQRSWKQIRDVLVSAGHGLEAAHRQGLVHRDFKPANVLVDGQDRARVLDFGLARAAEASRDEVSDSGQLLSMDLTQTGTLLGTPSYMAPEQFEGHADARSDQWGFCVTAYEMLYGGRPFGGTDARSMFAAVRAGKIPTPHASSTVPAWVFKALSRGLSVDPAKRFASMHDLLSALSRDKRSRRMQIMGVGLAVVLSSAGTAAALWATRPEPTVQSQAALDELEAAARSAAAGGWYVYPSTEDPSQPTALVNVIALEQLDGPIAEEAKQRAAALREEFAESLVQLGDEYWDDQEVSPFAADFYAAALLFDPQTERARERSILTPGELATLRKKAMEAKFTEAEVEGAAPLAALANPKKGKARATKLIARRTKGSKRQQPPVPVPTTPTKASPTRTPPVSSTPVEPTPEPKTLTPQPPPRDDKKGAKAEAAAGRAALRRGADGEAEKAFHRALSKNPRNETALAGLSEIYFERGAYQKALSYAKKAAGVAPRRGSIRMQLGDAYFKVHRYDDARREYTKAQKLGAKGAARALERIAAKTGQ